MQRDGQVVEENGVWTLEPGFAAEYGEAIAGVLDSWWATRESA
jgi:hypothetical protein